MESIGFIAALASAASWAFATVLFERIGKVVPYTGITFLKGLFSIVLMLGFAIYNGNLFECGFKEFAILAMSGIIGISIGDTLFFKSLQELGAKMQVLFFMLGQVVTMLLSFLLLGDILSIMEYVGIFILLGGVVIVTWGRQEDHPNKKAGLISGFLSILCYSISSIMIKVSIGDIDIVSATFYRMIFGTLVVMLAGFTYGKFTAWIRPLQDIKLFGLFLLNVVVITFGGFMLSMLAIKNISVSLASALSTTEPLFVLAFAFFINKEKIIGRELLGALITILGLLIIIYE